MLEAQFESSIRSAIAFVSDLKVWRSTVYNCALPRSQEFNKLSLGSKDYVEIYDNGLSLSHYNMQLVDFSYFQFSYTGPAEYALAYYPNPRLTGSPDAMEEFWELDQQRDQGDISEEDFADLLSTTPAKIFIPRIRFEYSGKQYSAVRHPGAHFHIGMSGEDRWASSRKLSPKSFTMLITKLYYPEVWWERSRFSKPAGEQEAFLEQCLDQKLVGSLQDDGVSHYFSAEEAANFHFSAIVGNVETNSAHG